MAVIISVYNIIIAVIISVYNIIIAVIISVYQHNYGSHHHCL